MTTPRLPRSSAWKDRDENAAIAKMALGTYGVIRKRTAFIVSTMGPDDDKPTIVDVEATMNDGKCLAEDHHAAHMKTFQANLTQKFKHEHSR